ncbi:MAG TPA: septum site-determining protein Ssd [Mycobacteriales bacterium]|nr:septum site-determining protein Ssd [Mycobacteriales bacterium]
MARPLIVTADDCTRDTLLRLAAVAGSDADVAVDVASARRRWRDPALVVVGADLASALRSAALPRRPGVVLLGDDLDDATVWQRAVELGAEHVAFLPDAEPWLIERLGAGAARGRTAVTVGVLGGRGGSGASTLAAALALSATRLGHRAVLVDADPLGGGLDLLLGAEDARGPRWPDVARVLDRGSGDGLAAVLPTVARTPVLSWDRSDASVLRPGAVSAVLAAAGTGVDVVVVDLPRRLDDASIEAFTAVGTLLLVVPADVRGVAASARIASAVAPYAGDLRLVVRRPPSGGIAAGFVADALGLPLAGCFKSERAVAADGDRGLPPPTTGRGHLARLCTALVRDLVPRGGDLGVAA